MVFRVNNTHFKCCWTIMLSLRTAGHYQKEQAFLALSVSSPLLTWAGPKQHWAQEGNLIIKASPLYSHRPAFPGLHLPPALKEKR